MLTLRDEKIRRGGDGAAEKAISAGAVALWVCDDPARCGLGIAPARERGAGHRRSACACRDNTAKQRRVQEQKGSKTGRRKSTRLLAFPSELTMGRRKIEIQPITVSPVPSPQSHRPPSSSPSSPPLHFYYTSQSLTLNYT